MSVEADVKITGSPSCQPVLCAKALSVLTMIVWEWSILPLKEELPNANGGHTGHCVRSYLLSYESSEILTTAFCYTEKSSAQPPWPAILTPAGLGAPSPASTELASEFDSSPFTHWILVGSCIAEVLRTCGSGNSSTH